MKVGQVKLSNEAAHKFAVAIIEGAVNMLKDDRTEDMWKNAAIKLLSEGLEMYKEYLKRRGYNVE